MVESKVKIQNKTGIHARPASLLVQEAEGFDSEIKVIKGEDEVNAKSIMGIMSLGIEQSTEITIAADGSDAQEAVDTLVELIESGFEE